MVTTASAATAVRSVSVPSGQRTCTRSITDVAPRPNLFEGLTRIPVNERWAGRLRLEMPLVLTNLPPDDDPGDAWRFGSGDLLSEADVIHYLNERWAMAAGTQVLFPTASHDVTGDDTWIIGPSGLVRAMLPEISPDSFVAPHLFYAFDIGGAGGSDHVSELHLQPLLHWAPRPSPLLRALRPPTSW